MDVKAIESIIKAMDNSELGYLEVNWDNISIIMKKQREEYDSKNINILDKNIKNLNSTSEDYESNIIISKEKKSDQSEVLKRELATENDDFIKEIKAPIVGTFYSSPGPDKPSFVNIGSRVKKGDVLCIIEAMKLMNEIQSEVDGEIVEILVKNKQMVEYGQLIFKIRADC